ncbi:hypothetical protein BHM03_00011288 [Ensete ventricosum]|nr:hypothetical protein BHM03_00011288 [Ensete ventricosum]
MGSSLGTHQEITGRRSEYLPQECRKLPDWWERVNRPYLVSEWLTVGTLPKSTGKSPVPDFPGDLDFWL